MSQILEWEDLSEAERQAIKVLSERSFLAFNRIFFQLLQGEKWSVNWHHRYIAQVIEDIVAGKRRNVVFNVPRKRKNRDVKHPRTSVDNAELPEGKKPQHILQRYPD